MAAEVGAEVREEVREEVEEAEGEYKALESSLEVVSRRRMAIGSSTANV